MRYVSCRGPAMLLVVFASAALQGCEPLPEEVGSEAFEPEVQAGHHPGGEASADASAELDAVNTVAAKMNGFAAGDPVGSIFVDDDGSTLTVTGHASGLDPQNDGGYLSLFYDVASSATGRTACEPGVHDPNDDRFLTNAQMFIGAWSVDAAGNGTLGPVAKTGAGYVGLEKIGTVSIRDTRIGGGFGVQAVVACGAVN